MATTALYEYDFGRVEARWQEYWLKQGTFTAREDAAGHARPKYYVLDMFPYPSGEGLHIGHPVGYFANDIITRFKRAQGHNVLHPIGWDAFGLPRTEQFTPSRPATHPAETTRQKCRALSARAIAAPGASCTTGRA